MYRYAALALVASVNAAQLNVEAQQAHHYNWEALAQKAQLAQTQSDASGFDW